MKEKPKRPSPKSVWTAPFFWMEWAIEWAVYTLSRLAIVKLLEFAGRFAIVVAVILFFTESEERARNARYAAWQLINSAQGKPGSCGPPAAM